MAHSSDLDLTKKDISGLASVDAIAAFLAKLGYDTSKRSVLTPQAIGLTEDVASATKKIELLSADADDFLRVVFIQLKSLTAKSRNGFVTALKKSNIDHLLICVSNFDTLEFVLLDKSAKKRSGASSQAGIEVIARIVAVDRKDPSKLELKALRRLTWTCRDSLDQYDKLRSVFQAAAYTEEHFQNRALFADHYLMERLKDDPLWQDNPSEMFAGVKELLKDAARRWRGKGEKTVRDELYEPLFEQLGFKLEQIKEAHDDNPHPDYVLKGQNGTPLTAAFVYEWDRWLDGPDFNDQDTPEENPGACVISTLESGDYGWVVVTNGRLWRLYSRQAHSRATNFYEVDLTEALIASGDTDPNEAFRYWWLFFRSEAFAPIEADGEVGCWLDLIVRGSRDYAKRLGERLKDRIFVKIFPHLAIGFLEDRKQRLGHKKTPSNEGLKEIFEATLTLLYRLLFLLYAESRDLLPIREGPYREASLKKIKEEIAGKAGGAKSDAEALLKKAYLAKETKLYDRLTRLFKVMDKGDASLNVPTYNGGLFITSPEKSDKREHRIARFLAEHKVPDRRLAMAIDLLARDQDEKTFGLVFIDYKSLEVRHLGSIYEGLLEFKLKIAEEDLTTRTEKKKEKFIPLAKAKPKRGKTAETVVRKGEVYLSNDKAERKATGSYYTPDPIVEYIVEHTVGPVLEEKLEALRLDFRKVRKTYDRHLQNAKTHPLTAPTSEDKEPRQFAAKKMYLEHKDLVERFFDMKVLDPAMGSGHFLVEAVDFITDRLLSFLNQFPINPISFMLEQTRRNILQALDEQQVAVDSTKLTDVNLLKRHVLKRSVYGVDLNPMAVELAKVSLWLDAFTLGAPLNFLDHHLRCGNSLIGATFEDLKNATSGQLFAIDYGPLMRAIQHVVFVNEMADATASEVHKSAVEYTQARKELSGYQIVLDLLVADHFVEDNPKIKPSSLLTHAQELDLDTRDALVASLQDDNERRLVEQIESVARRPDIRFFHWEIEFPEVFFGFSGADKRLLRHKDLIAQGTAGFDAIVGNPPYINVVELDEEIRTWLITHFDLAKGRVDIYIPFLEKSLQLLSRGGQSGMITPNKWYVYGYGGPLREVLLSGDFHWISAVDLSLAKSVFGDANTYSQVSIFRRPRPDETRPSIAVTRFTRDEPAAIVDLREAASRGVVERHTVPPAIYAQLPSRVFAPRLNPVRLVLLNKIRRISDDVGQLFEIEQLIRIGSREKRQALITKHPSRDAREARRVIDADELERWAICWEGRYLLYRPNELYNPKTPEIFETPKIFLKDTSANLQVVPDFGDPHSPRRDQWYYALNTVYGLIPRSSADSDIIGFVASCLNSPLSDYLYKLLFGALTIRGGYIRFREFIQYLPIPRVQFSTPAEERAAQCERLSAEYDSLLQGLDQESFSDFVGALRNENSDLASPDDVLHDFLVYLSSRMIDLNRLRVVETRAFLGWIDAELSLHSSASSVLDGLSGKSLIKNYAGNYCKDQAELAFADLWKIVNANHRRITRTLNGRFEDEVRDRYEESLRILVPIKHQLRITDWLMAQVTYRLYGLDKDEISMVELGI